MSVNDRKPSAPESIFFQALSTTILILRLDGDGFLNSDYYKKIDNLDVFVKDVLAQSGLGNPATLQMFLYVLLVMPKEIMEKEGPGTENLWKNEINAYISNFRDICVSSTYSWEDQSNLSTIDFYGHIRNAVSHSRCSYSTEKNTCYVTFFDQNNKKVPEKCSIKMSTGDVGLVLGKLQDLMLTYLKGLQSKH